MVVAITENAFAFMLYLCVCVCVYAEAYLRVQFGGCHHENALAFMLYLPRTKKDANEYNITLLKS